MASVSPDPRSLPPEPAPVEPGQIVAGKFRIERIIGEGGMGVVAEATHLHLDQHVALKFLRREVMRMPEVVARFNAEARAVVKLKSEHVARVSDVGKTDDGIPFMVMELLDGTDLGQLVDESGPLLVSEAVDYIIQACEGVGEAHARGIVHRDLKPENLFLVKRGDWGIVKVLDFGISKAVLVGPTSVDLSSSQTTSIMGSPYYMSPEQLRSTKSVDHRTDVWSLGVVLFELLTGRTIFDETKEFTELVAEILEMRHRSLTVFRARVPSALEDVIDKCLEKDRTRRYQNVAELAVALLPFAPRRARVTVERTTSIARAAGIITDPDFRLPPSNYPPAIHSGPPGPLDATLPRMPVPVFDAPQEARLTPAPSPPASAPSSPIPMPASSTPSLSTSSQDLPQKNRNVPVLVGTTAILLVGVVLAFFLGRGTRAQTDTTQVVPSGSTSVAQLQMQPSTTVTSPQDTSSALTATTASVASTPTHSHPTTAATTPTNVAKPKPSASAVPSKPTLEIQMER